MLRESLQGSLVDPHDDITHVDAAALRCRLAGKQLFNAHHAGAQGFIWNVFLSAETEAQPRGVLPQTHLEHVICGDKHEQIRPTEGFLFHASM